MNIKMIILDVDGTLFSSDKVMLPRTKKALMKHKIWESKSF